MWIISLHSSIDRLNLTIMRIRKQNLKDTFRLTHGDGGDVVKPG